MNLRVRLQQELTVPVTRASATLTPLAPTTTHSLRTCVPATLASKEMAATACPPEVVDKIITQKIKLKLFTYLSINLSSQLLTTLWLLALALDKQSFIIIIIVIIIINFL